MSWFNIAYRIHFWYVREDDVININVFYVYKMSNKTYYQRNRKVALNKAKDYYENNKEELGEQARNRYRNLPEEEKIKKREYGKNRYHKMSEEKKQY